jgi:alkaline phosphatase D
MSYRLGLGLAALILSACAGAGSSGSSSNGTAGPAPIQTSFVANTEGWSLRSFATDENDYTMDPDLVSAVTWDATGGNPGGAITREDFIGETDYFETPAAFHGDLSAYYGGTLSFDIRESETDGPFSAPLVLLQAGNDLWLYNGGPDATTGWTTFRVPLDVSAEGWTLASNGSAATEDAFRASLAATTGLWLRGEFSDGEDNSWLDNVIVSR